MTTADDSGRSLDRQLEALRSVEAVESAQRVLQGVHQRARAQRRQVIAAACGTCIALIGTIHFVLRGDPVGYVALALATAVLARTAWRSAHAAAGLGDLKPGASLLAGWREELEQQLRHALFAQLVAGLFVALTAWVVWTFGLLSWKAVIYLAMATAVTTFAAYQQLVVRPALQRELAALDQDG